MAKITIALGVVLVLLGLGGFVGTGSSHYTALIPAGFGVALIVCGVLALSEHRRMHAMHAAVLLSLIGFVFPTFMTARDWPTLLTQGQVIKEVTDKDGTTAMKDRAVAVGLNMATALVCLVHVGLSVNSFVQARRARKQAG